MRFGVRLPGPFRVGIGRGGRVSVGMTAGPFSASTAINQQRRPANPGEAFYPITLDGAVAELVTMGWLPRGHDGRSAILTRGWRAVQVDAVDGGVTWRRVTSRRSLLAWTVAVIVVVLISVNLLG